MKLNTHLGTDCDPFQTPRKGSTMLMLCLCHPPPSRVTVSLGEKIHTWRVPWFSCPVQPSGVWQQLPTAATHSSYPLEASGLPGSDRRGSSRAWAPQDCGNSDSSRQTAALSAPCRQRIEPHPSLSVKDSCLVLELPPEAGFRFRSHLVAMELP